MIDARPRKLWAGAAMGILGVLLVAGGAAHSAEYDAMGIQPTNDWSSVQFLKWGPFDVHPTASASVLYDDNIYINTSTNVQSDFIWVTTPGVVVGLGDYLARQGNLLLFHYMPSFLFFTEHN